MRKSGMLVPVAALLLSGVLAAGAAGQETVQDPIRRGPDAAVAAHGELRPGNPLWAITVGELSETQARPLFSPSRRPPVPPVVAAPPMPPRNAGASPTREPAHPLLTLLGTIVSEAVAIGVFVDEASHDVIRLKAGEAHEGWTLHAVSGRAATFHKDGERAATLALPTPGGEPPGPGNNRITGVPPANALEPHVTPATTKGGIRKSPKES
jgi:hypothetical protein